VTKGIRSVLEIFLGALTVSSLFGQAKQVQQIRRPPALPEVQQSQKKEWDGSVFVLNGMPMLMELHHDTEVGTGRPVDVDVFVIEMQIMNSDGNLEPVGLQIHNFFTAKAQDPKNAFNPHNARDCRAWNSLVLRAMAHRDPKSKTWPYVELVTNTNARVIQTNEDGQVWWSDDVECWGSSDRFSPF
jgi:hypothetical protein